MISGLRALRKETAVTRRQGVVLTGLAVGLETLNRANAETLSPSYRRARSDLEAVLINERDTLDSILELAPVDMGLEW